MNHEFFNLDQCTDQIQIGGPSQLGKPPTFTRVADASAKVGPQTFTNFLNALPPES